MKRFLLATVFSAVPVLVYPTHSDAQLAVVCVTCSSLVEQLVSDAKQAQQYLTEVSELQTDLRMYSNMVQNTVALPQTIWPNVQSDILQVRNLANAASVLTGGSGTILTRLQTAGGYLNSAAFLPGNIAATMTGWQTTMGNATKTLGSTLGVQQSQLNSYTALQAAIQTHSQTAAGQMQAIQAGTEMSGQIATILQQVQTTLVASSTAAATFEEIEADKEAAQNAQVQQFLAAPDQPLTGYQRY